MQVIAVLLLFVIPAMGGYPLLRLSGLHHRPVHVLEIPVLLFFLGLVPWAFLSWAGGVFGFGLTATFLVYLAFTGFLYVLSFRRKGRSFKVANAKFGDSEVGALFGILFLAVVFYLVGTTQAPFADTYRHLASIRKIFEGLILSKEVYAHATNNSDLFYSFVYSYNGTYSLYALVAHICRLDPSLVWLRAGGVMTPVFLLASFCFVYQISEEKKHSLYLLYLPLVFLMLGPMGKLIRNTVYPFAIGLSAYMVLSALILEVFSRERPRIGLLLLLSLGVATLIMIHPMAWTFLLGTIACFGIYRLITGRRRELLWLMVLLCLAILFSLPIVFSKADFIREALPRMGSVLRWHYPGLWMFGQYYAFNPLRDPLVLWIPMMSSFVFLFWTLRARNLSENEQVTFSAFMVVILTLIRFNPFVVAAVSKLLTLSQVYRLGILITLWGIFPLISVVKDLAARVSRRYPSRLQLSKGLMVGAASLVYAGVFIWYPVLALYQGRPEIKRQRILDMLSRSTFLPEDFLSIVSDNLWIFLAALSAVICMGCYALAVFYAGSGNECDPTRSRQGMRILKWSLPALICALIVFSPNKQFSFWSFRAGDYYASTLRGPVISQVANDPDFREMINRIPSRSTVLSDLNYLFMAYADIKTAGDFFLLKGDRQNRKESFFDPGMTWEKRLERLLELQAEYLALSPKHFLLASDLEQHPEYLRKIFQKRINSVEYLNKSFTLFRIDLPLIQKKLAARDVT